MLTLDTIFILVAFIMLAVQFVLLVRTICVLAKPISGPFDLCLVKGTRDNCRIWSVVITVVSGLLIAYNFGFIFMTGFSALMTIAIFFAGKIEEK